MDSIPSADDCWSNAARLLRMSEMETDRDLMDKYDTIARSWMMLGSLVEGSNEYTP